MPFASLNPNRFDRGPVASDVNRLGCVGLTSLVQPRTEDLPVKFHPKSVAPGF